MYSFFAPLATVGSVEIVPQRTRVAEAGMSFREFVFIDYKSSDCDYRGVHIPQRMQAHKIPDDKPADSNRSQTKYHGADGKP